MHTNTHEHIHTHTHLSSNSERNGWHWMLNSRNWTQSQLSSKGVYHISCKNAPRWNISINFSFSEYFLEILIPMTIDVSFKALFLLLRNKCAKQFNHITKTRTMCIHTHFLYIDLLKPTNTNIFKIWHTNNCNVIIITIKPICVIQQAKKKWTRAAPAAPTAK